MLSHCLIFLCIGVYASCMPTPLPIFLETITLLDKIMKEGNILRPKNESMQSVEIPITIEKECASYGLDKYIEALHLLKIEDSKNLTNVHNILKGFAKSKAINKILKTENGNENCEKSIININKFLAELLAFLTELNQLLKSNEGTTK